MRRIFGLMALAILAALPGAAANLKDVRSVYLLPMSGGLDQYLAVSLTTGNVLQVVADPQRADAIFTDHLGENLETRLDELYGAKPKDDEKDQGNQKFARVQSGNRGRGAIFLV